MFTAKKKTYHNNLVEIIMSEQGETIEFRVLWNGKGLIRCSCQSSRFDWPFINQQMGKFQSFGIGGSAAIDTDHIKVGALLFNLLPQAMRRFLIDHCGAYATLLIRSDPQVFFPWNLVYLDTSSPGFLFEFFAIVHWPLDMKFVQANVDLTTKAYLGELQKDQPRISGIQFEIFKHAGFINTLRTQDANLWLLFGHHGNLDEGLLTGDKTDGVRVDDILALGERFRRSAPIVILCACETAHLNRRGGWADAFIRAGASAVLVVTSNITPTAMSLFLERFLKELGRGLTVANAFGKAMLSYPAPIAIFANPEVSTTSSGPTIRSQDVWTPCRWLKQYSQEHAAKVGACLFLFLSSLITGFGRASLSEREALIRAPNMEYATEAILKTSWQFSTDSIKAMLLGLTTNESGTMLVFYLIILFMATLIIGRHQYCGWFRYILPTVFLITLVSAYFVSVAVNVMDPPDPGTSFDRVVAMRSLVWLENYQEESHRARESLHGLICWLTLLSVIALESAFFVQSRFGIALRLLFLASMFFLVGLLPRSFAYAHWGRFYPQVSCQLLVSHVSWDLNSCECFDISGPSKGPSWIRMDCGQEGMTDASLYPGLSRSKTSSGTLQAVPLK